MSRHYYALYAAYGVQSVYNDYNYPWPCVFRAKAERDKWVQHDTDHREAVTAREAAKYTEYDNFGNHTYYTPRAMADPYYDDMISPSALRMW